MTQEVKLKRVECNYQAENARFLLECDFSNQYSYYYRKRLEKTRPFLEFNCREKWNPKIPMYNLTQLAAVSYCDNDDYLEEEIMSPSVSSPAAQSSFEFAKRIRRLSEGSSQSPNPKTSTQKEYNKLDSGTGSLFSTPVSRTPLESPILRPEEEKDEETHDCIVIGIIFKRMKLQPNVVDELSKGDFHVKCERYPGHYTSQDDTLVLEDTNESISLSGNIDPKQFVTGIVVALLGVPINDGSQFLVKDICYAEPNQLLLYEDEISLDSSDMSIEKPLRTDSAAGAAYLMLVSGFGFHQDMSKRSILTKALQDLIDFIWGGAKYEEDERSSRVSRILVIGDSLHETRLTPDEGQSSQKDELVSRMKQSRQVKQYSGSIQAVKHMDDFFAQLSKTINVDVMPGPSDPSSHLMPQQPFHPCMFPKSCMFSTFNCTTNPFHATYNDNIEVLATSGQNIDIISKFSGIHDPLEIMKCHLKWGNIAPSAPDNLYSAPYEDEDPFIVDFIPEVYVAGCQDSYRTDYYSYNSNKSNQLSKTLKSRTLLVTIPRFCETFSCVLLNLQSLETHLLSFR